MTGDETTRRSFLGSVAAAGGAAALIGGRGGSVAADAGLLPLADPAPAGRAINALPAPTAGTRYTLIRGDQFVTSTNIGTYNNATGGALDSGSIFGLFRCHLYELPQGARITEVVFAFTKDPTYAWSVYFQVVRWTPGSEVGISYADTNLVTQQNVEQYVAMPVANPASNWIVDNSAARHTLMTGYNSGSGTSRFKVNSVRIGWLPPTAPLGFYPIAPKRVYDSRRPAGDGLLTEGTSRVVSVKDGFVNDTDTLDAPNVVPVGAKAIAYNLTIVGTTGAGFLSVGPGDATLAAGSAINWGGPNQVLANGLTVTLDGLRQIKVFAGQGGGTQFVIDVMGYYA